MSGGFVGGALVPGKPHPLLVPERSPAWSRLREGFEDLRRWIQALEPDLLVLYSSQWLSVIGHQMQADPEPEWVHVDPDWHELGSMPYRFRMDAAFAEAWCAAARRRGLHARTVAYRGFPVDTGTIVALKLLNPDNAIPAAVVSCNMYADRGETLVLGKATADAVRAAGKRAVAVAVSALSNRYHTGEVDPAEDHVSALKDDEWNRKILELLGEGRLEDVSQLARQFSREAHGEQKFKAIWWLAAALGQNNRYQGAVHAYGPIHGTGAGVVSLRPAQREFGRLEYDEDDAEVYQGDREVLAGGGEVSSPGGESGGGPGIVLAEDAPEPVGAYPHARRVGSLLFLSGVGPRQPGTDEIPGGPVRDAQGRPRDYDIRAQTRAVIENVRRILEAAGSSLDRVLDVTCFLVDMERDFEGFNEVYREAFEGIQAARTTLAIRALPTPIAVEFKVIAEA